MNKIGFEKISLFFLFTFLILIFFIEVIYLLPSPQGDEKYFVNLMVNICNFNTFEVETTPHAEKGQPEWKLHGYLGYYIFSKLNYSCETNIYFLLNYLVKILSILLGYFIFKKNNLDLFSNLLCLFTIIICQLYNPFRPETFSIFVYLLILYFFCIKNFYITGFFISALFFTHPTIFYLFGLFYLLNEYRIIFKNFKKLFLGFLIGIVVIHSSYEYSFFDYLLAPLNNSGTYNINGFKFDHLIEHYVLNKKAPFFLLIFLILYFYTFKINRLMILTLPFIFFFGPMTGLHEYNLLALIPLLLYLISKNGNSSKIKLKFILPIVIILMSIPYLSRNIYTIIYYGNNFELTAKFIETNKSKIRYLPTFIKFTNPKIKLKKNTQPENIIFEDKFVDLYDVSGNRKQCKTLSKKKPGKKIFGKKIFNSNSGYDVYVCDQ
tara:strand:- start:2266 stop:3570 length:1305 start_codon:yes stop_codon:yes gene_type:complete